MAWPSGSWVGAEVGAEVGADVGADVGFEVGADVGFEVGFGVGFEVGFEVGFGSDVGFGAGVFEGGWVGRDTTGSPGASVGPAPGASVGTTTGPPLGGGEAGVPGEAIAPDGELPGFVPGDDRHDAGGGVGPLAVVAWLGVVPVAAGEATAVPGVEPAARPGAVRSATLTASATETRSTLMMPSAMTARRRWAAVTSMRCSGGGRRRGDWRLLRMVAPGPSRRVRDGPHCQASSTTSRGSYRAGPPTGQALEQADLVDPESQVQIGRLGHQPGGEARAGGDPVRACQRQVRAERSVRRRPAGRDEGLVHPAGERSKAVLLVDDAQPERTGPLRRREGAGAFDLEVERRADTGLSDRLAGASTRPSSVGPMKRSVRCNPSIRTQRAS